MSENDPNKPLDPNPSLDYVRILGESQTVRIEIPMGSALCLLTPKEAFDLEKLIHERRQMAIKVMQDQVPNLLAGLVSESRYNEIDRLREEASKIAKSVPLLGYRAIVCRREHARFAGAVQLAETLLGQALVGIAEAVIFNWSPDHGMHSWDVRVITRLPHQHSLSAWATTEELMRNLFDPALGLSMEHNTRGPAPPAGDGWSKPLDDVPKTGHVLEDHETPELPL